jgi:hypothetical protein
MARRPSGYFGGSHDQPKLTLQFALRTVPELTITQRCNMTIAPDSLPWLRKPKAAAARHKDLDDLEHLPES